ncbi:NAD(P)/FAD-dependent oxidoreductase [Kribbella capetownensis]|uniref:NAD(P)/FAD-dependent oxidoreductase n=1 Tax=Kribbella capetownensis TaxID=1572659 RepID=A0A4R0JHK5_9ACTN|nr:NAD(P)/FAD-dependent oxidoreductase [Kribbella capetownensis]TCC46503.1 NAD(P)/FAD-dependent oxidoreductase [Kribbella capetownensis]
MYDVVVVGARCAGAATAMLLARMGHDVVMVDKARLPSDTLSTHGLIRGGVVQLSRWGLLDRVLASGAPAVTHVTFDIEGEPKTRRIKERAGVDMLVAPRRRVLDSLLADAAVEAGAGLRTGVTVTGLQRSDHGRVTGIVGHSANGDRVELPARIVVGADGRQSRLAGYAGAETLERFISPCAVFYTYVTGLAPDTYQFHIAPDTFAGVFPTHDGQACVWLIRPTDLLEPIRTAGSGRSAAFVEQLELLVPNLGRQVRAGRIAARLRGIANLPNFRRQAHGPGWALVGDAGYHRDPITGHGITDAFRDAELLADAIGNGLRDASVEPAAMAAYQNTRDAMAREVFDLTRALTAFPPPQRFVELQIELSEALEQEADRLASFPDREATSSAA